MGIKTWLITGDTHGNFNRFKEYDEKYNNEETAVIILGDAALNWTLTEQDNLMKNYLAKHYNFRIYCVRGNHEARPQDVPDMELVYDEDVDGGVYIQNKWPNIRYFKDWGIYTINNLSVAVIGGAYSVDKFYRLDRAKAAGKNIETDWTSWFVNEELSNEEMDECFESLKGQYFDLVLTHTCPLPYEPTDLFLNSIDQNTVSKRMEEFLYKLSNNIDWSIWCFGHYHADRIEAPFVEQYYRDTEELNELIERWDRYTKTGELDWWLQKSPNFIK